MNQYRFSILSTFILVSLNYAFADSVRGDLKVWYKVMTDFAEPQSSETSSMNPFTDYRLDVELYIGGCEDLWVQWFDPRNGGSLRQGSKKTLIGGNPASIGDPPDSAQEDWICLIRS